MTEIWKDIPDYEGLYQASNLGRIKSLAKSWVGGNGALMIKPDTILKENANSCGYLSVSLRKNGKGLSKTVHRLVYETFNGKTNLQIDHIIEGNKTDNRLCNLQAITLRQNVSKHRLTTKKSSQYTGVSWDKYKNKWSACISINCKTKHLGKFTSEIDAHNAYQNALSEKENYTILKELKDY